MADMLRMFPQQIRVDQDVVQVYNNENVIHVMKDVVHEVLKSGGGVSHSEEHYEVLKEAIAGAKGGLPFMSWSDLDIVVARAEVYLCVNLGTAEMINEVSNQGEGIPVLFGDFVEPPIIHTELEGPILLLGEQNRSASSGDQWAYKALAKHVIEVFLQGSELDLGHVVDLAKPRLGTFLKVDLVIVGVVRGKFFGTPFREHVSKLMILQGNYFG
ncbi:hypothetical protein C0989_004339 [Termitomyces sp. Mn162]|nr:hypothetical protein C0989_004339 [Termitomyces sp. Mn162]